MATIDPTPEQLLTHIRQRPRAWLCELVQEDGTTRTQFVEQDPEGLRWSDAGEPSPYRTTPLYAGAELEALRKDSELLAWVLAHPETAAEELEDAAGGDGTPRENLERRIAGIAAARARRAVGAA